MDRKTAKYYDDNAAETFERYEAVESKIADYFCSSFAEKGRILDIGSGSGRDICKLLDLGYDAFGIEPCDELRKKSLSKSHSLEGRIVSGSLPNIDTSKQYDGILCSAVFMHIPISEHLDSLINIRALLKPSGRLLISIPKARPNLDTESRDQQGRLFESLEPEKLKLLCARLGLQCITEYSNKDSLGRVDHEWVTLLFEKKLSLGRPLDRIESVLRNDRKTATYKLALIRAFCDLAERDDNAVDWRSSKQVALPVTAVVECWLLYYWPLLSGPDLLPQNNSIAGGGRPMLFRESLESLIKLANEYYQSSDDKVVLSLFVMDLKKGKVNDALKEQLRITLQRIRTAILTGPIKHAEQGQMFFYEKASRSILIDADLWGELCLTGYWIKDSLLLRWAELCEKFSRQLPNVTQNIVLERLLLIPEVKREQDLARRICLSFDSYYCVWSGKKLNSKTLAIDHVLPYSLWHNNQLWNLLPSYNKVNNDKSNHVPSTHFLISRKDPIISYWERLQAEETDVFQYEIKQTLGSFDKKKWELQLFSHLKGRAEQGIYARGAKAWHCPQDMLFL